MPAHTLKDPVTTGRSGTIIAGNISDNGAQSFKTRVHRHLLAPDQGQEGADASVNHD